MKQEQFNKITILIMTIGVTVVFIGMIKGFLMAIFMAALFAGLLFPVYNKLKSKNKGKPTRAAFGTILLFIFIILLPVSIVLIIVVDQAIAASESVRPLLIEITENPIAFVENIRSIPIVSKLYPDQVKLVKTINDIVNELGNFVIQGLSDFTAGTASFVFSFFIFLFTLYYFLVYGKEYMETFLYYLPLKNEEEQILLNRFTRVTKATLKGTFLIGLIQGTLGAIGMAIVGLPNVIFWGLIMTILSIIPALGAAIVWVPASILLLLQGEIVNGVVLIGIGAIIVSNIDNLLRPSLVGKDAQMPDLMILFGTLGGLAMFGISGVIIGPIIAALFISLWDIYGRAFKEYLFPVNIEELSDELENILEDKGGDGK
jgi:predicted PurR-regulated permease PerM